MPFNDTNTLPLVLRYALPYPDRLVVRARCKESSVWGESECPDGRCVSRQRGEAKPVFGWIVDVEFYRIVV